MFQSVHSAVNYVRETFAHIPTTTDVRGTGRITPENFVAAGDYLTSRFQLWHWGDAHPGKRVSHLPAGRQYLYTLRVPCHRRLDDNFAGDAVEDGMVIKDGEGFEAAARGGSAGDDEDGWLRTGKLAASQEARARDVRTVDDSGNMGEKEADEEEYIPDMEDLEDDPEAIIREPIRGADRSLRRYNIYITYSTPYLTPQMFLSGYDCDDVPLDPKLMMEDVVGDYQDKTVTLENFPLFADNIRMISVHPCKHASVMKILMDRADQALKIRREKLEKGLAGGALSLEGLADDVNKLGIVDKKIAENKSKGEDEWEVIPDDDNKGKDEVAIRVDQYLIVFLKFMASVMPTIEHDYTMSI